MESRYRSTRTVGIARFGMPLGGTTFLQLPAFCFPSLALPRQSRLAALPDLALVVREPSRGVEGFGQFGTTHTWAWRARRYCRKSGEVLRRFPVGRIHPVHRSV